MLTDLDRAECPPMLLSEWFREAPRHPNLLFRIAVREVESWLLAHRSAFAHFMRISESLIRSDVEAVDDPKEYLINLATKSRRRAIREDVVPLPRSTSRQGPNYNGRLIEYVETAWDPRVAMMLSASLARAVEALDTFSPTWSADAD